MKRSIDRQCFSRMMSVTSFTRIALTTNLREYDINKFRRINSRDVMPPQQEVFTRMTSVNKFARMMSTTFVK